jgi:hypothetical protein
MHIARQVLGAATLALASFLALSCNNEFGIFKDVQGQTAQKGTSQFQETAASNVFGLGGYYYAATSRLYRRGVADSSWSQVDVGDLSTYTLYSAVASSSSVYLLVWKDSKKNASDSANQNALFSSKDGSTWSQIPNLFASWPKTMSSSDTFQFETLFVANGTLYAVGHLYAATAGSSFAGSSSYYLYYLNASNVLTPVSMPASTIATLNFFPTLSSQTIRGVVYDGSSYWFASENQLCNGTSFDGSNATSVIGNYGALSSKTIWGLSSINGDLGTSPSGLSSVYITTKDGVLYQGDTAAGYTITSIPLTVVVQVPSPSGPIILVGTDSDDVNSAAVGYYEGTFGSLSVGSNNYIVSHTSSIYTTTVSIFPVHAFYYDAVLGNVFVAISPGYSSSSYYGLYESSWDAATSAWSGWSAQ